MKNLIVLALYLTGLSITGSCKKDSSSPGQQTGTAEITEVGIANGQLVTQTIGSGGGTVVSSDGIMELIFPSNALNSNTNISIQPITNNSPGGVGNGYRFGPSGIKFNTPVTLKFHYNDNVIKGTLPQFIGIAFQDSNRGWYSLRSFTYDTINKTITAKSNHFSDYATFADLILVPSNENVKINESKVFKVMVLDDPLNDQQKALSLPTGSDNETAPLVHMHEVNSGLLKNWAANGVIGGNNQYGTITPQDAHCSFTAPGKKPSGNKNPVQLSVEINMRYKDPLTNKDYGKLRLNSAVKIIDDNYSYSLRIDYKIIDLQEGSCTWEALDSASFDVEVKNDIALISGYENHNGIVHPATQMPAGINCTVTWLPKDDNGILNITKASGYAAEPVSGIPGKPKTLIFSIINDRSDPMFSFVCTSGESSLIGGHVTAGLYYGASFMLKDSSQVFHDPQTPGLIYTLTAK
jgi:hypothetical protein